LKQNINIRSDVATLSSPLGRCRSDALFNVNKVMKRCLSMENGWWGGSVNKREKAPFVVLCL